MAQLFHPTIIIKFRMTHIDCWRWGEDSDGKREKIRERSDGDRRSTIGYCKRGALFGGQPRISPLSHSLSLSLSRLSLPLSLSLSLLPVTRPMPGVDEDKYVVDSDGQNQEGNDGDDRQKLVAQLELEFYSRKRERRERKRERERERERESNAPRTSVQTRPLVTGSGRLLLGKLPGALTLLDPFSAWCPR